MVFIMPSCLFEVVISLFLQDAFFLLVYLAFLLSSHVLVVHSGIRVEMTKTYWELWARVRLVHHELHQVNLNGSVSISSALPYWYGQISQNMLAGGSVLGVGVWAGVREGRGLQIHPTNSNLAFSKGHPLHCGTTRVIALFNSALVSPKVAGHA